MNWFILFTIMAVQPIVISMFSPPQITVNVSCASTVHVSCTGMGSSNGLWTFYMKRKKQRLQNIANVLFNELECDVTYFSTIKSSQCECITGTGVMCNISSDNVVNAGDEWYCSHISTGSPYYSKSVYLPNQESSECTNSSLQEHTTVQETDHSTGGKTIIVTSFTHNTEMKVTPNFTAGLVNYTMEESAYFSSRSHVSNTISTPKEESVILYFSTFSSREFIVIITAAGSAVLIAVCASICTYWKLKMGFRAVNNPVAENDNATVQHNAIDANILQMPLQENTYVHYHEISEVSTVDINLAVDNQNIEIDISDIHVRDVNLSTSTMELGTINPLLHMTENDPSTSWAGKPLQKDPMPIVFMSLAEMTISDVDVTGSNILRADMEGACYENLDPERRDDKSQYNSLV